MDDPIGDAALPCREGSVVPLPSDTRDRVDLIRELLGGACEVADDGEFVTVAGWLPDDAVLPRLELCGGDLRVLSRDGGAWFELRMFRDGRPAGVAAVLRPREPWPAGGGAIAVDCDGARLAPGEFVALLDRAGERRRQGRDVCLLNVPPHLRFFAEALGRAGELPMRAAAGPRLPGVLEALWR